MPTFHSTMDSLLREMGWVLSSSIDRLLVAAILGGIIGLERQLRHKPAGLRTNMFICFGAAMFTILSKQLAGTESDSARIAAQIIPGIGFIGAGSILHARASVTGLTTAATIFVVASVGIDRKSTRLNSSHQIISYAVFCLKKKKTLHNE